MDRVCSGTWTSVCRQGLVIKLECKKAVGEEKAFTVGMSVYVCVCGGGSTILNVEYGAV